MESSNLHQDHHLPHSPSSSSTPTSLFPHSWSSLNAGSNLSPNLQETNLRSRAFTHNKKDIGRGSHQQHQHHFFNASSGLGYHHHHQWESGEEHNTTTESDQYGLDLHYSKIKQEIPEAAFPCKFTDMLNTSCSGSSMDNKHNFNSLSDKLLLKTLSSSSDFYSSSGSQNFASNNFGGGGNLGMGMAASPSRRTSFSQIYPSINISNFNNNHHHSSSSSSSFDMNMHSDLLMNSTRFNGGLSLHHHHHHAQDHGLPRFDNNVTTFPLDHHLHMHQNHHQIDRSSCSLSNPSQFISNNGIMGETKRPSTSLVESKATSCQSQNVTKKSRLESRSSCPPFKVRKEKLGDRIAALQQLVAPFGKTDTASVLMEAIGYIKFLQSQVETLSVPYMKPSRNQNNRDMHVVQGPSGTREEPKIDLKSRGLCLVPLSCMSYFTDGSSGGGVGGGGGWQQPEYGGASL